MPDESLFGTLGAQLFQLSTELVSAMASLPKEVQEQFEARAKSFEHRATQALASWKDKPENERGDYALAIIESLTEELHQLVGDIRRASQKK